MKCSTFFLIVLILTFLALTINNSQRSFAEIGVNTIIVHADYPDCDDFTWQVSVVKNGGGFSDVCTISSGGSCKCPVSGLPAGYYTITIDNGSCTAVKYNVYHSGSGYNDVYVNSALDCYR